MTTDENRIAEMLSKGGMDHDPKRVRLQLNENTSVALSLNPEHGREIYVSLTIYEANQGWIMSAAVADELGRALLAKARGR